VALFVALAMAAPATPAETGSRISVASGGAFAPSYGSALPPLGYVQFCNRHPADCLPGASRAAPVQLSEARWLQLVQINDYVNRSIAPVTDQELHKVPEHWDYPVNQGDCEDYVLLKRRYLAGLGWPIDALLITVVLDHNNDGHAVLTVVTDGGEFVLDNQNPEIVAWRDTGYRFLKRQSREDPRQWSALSPIGDARAGRVAGPQGADR
jgi:predicted transglutaminase-like cysteine proteinase